jgi:hypothetical protein
MRIPDEQLDLMRQRLEAIGIDRRGFLQVVGAMAAFGGLGFVTTAEAVKPTKIAAGDKLAKDQTLRYGGGGAMQNDPATRPATTSTRTSTAVASRPSSRG